MRDGICAFCGGNLYLFFSDKRPAQGSPEEISALVAGIGPQSRKDKITDEFFP